MEATNERAKWEKIVDFLTKRNDRLEEEGEEKDKIIAELEATIHRLLTGFQAAQNSSPLETTSNIEQLELHDLLNGKQILVIGACACKPNHLLGYAKNWFAVQKKDFKFVTEYGSIKNRDHGIYEEWKLMPEEVGMAILNIIKLPKKVYIPYLDIRPLKPLKDDREGIEKLQYV